MGSGKKSSSVLILITALCLFLSCQGCTVFPTASPSGSASVSQQAGSVIKKVYKKPQTVEFTPSIIFSSAPVIPPASSGALKSSLISFVYNSLYSVHNVDTVDRAIEILSRSEYLICGEPARLADKEVLVADAIKSQVKIFGYINMGGDVLPSLDSLRSEINNIRQNGWYGVFIDQFGYDYGETRERQNAVVNYAHGVGLKCFVNAWFIDDVFGTEMDAVHNPNRMGSALGEDDWYLLESFLTRTDGYDEYPDDFWAKLKKAQEYNEKYKANMACLSYKRDAATWEESVKDVENSYLLNVLAGFKGWWFTDRCENDSFIYGKPTIDAGDVLTKKLYQVIPGYYLAETDKYLFLYNASQFPVMDVEVFDIKFKTDLLDYLLNKES